MKLFALAVLILCIVDSTVAATITGWTGFTVSGTNAATASGTATAKVEGSIGTLFTVTATNAASPTYAFAANGNPSSIASASITDGAVVLGTGKTLDYETATSYIFVIVATDDTDHGTATVTLSITNKLEFSATTLTGCAVAGAAANSVVGAWTVSDKQSADTVTYTLGGNDASTFSLAGSTGVLSVGSTALSTTIGHTYALTLTADAAAGTGASTDSDATTLTLTVAATCSGVTQLTALLGVLLLSVMTAMSM